MENVSGTEKREANAGRLLSSMEARMLLSAFGVAGTPSEVAKRVGLPANSVHYWAGKLVDAGLLQQVEQKGRQRVYQAVPDTTDVERAACGPLMANVSSALHAAFLAAAELHDRIAPCDGSLEDGEGLSRPQLRISELSMSRSDYESVVEQLLERVPSAPPEGSSEKSVDGETYTLSVIAFRGRISDYF